MKHLLIKYAILIISLFYFSSSMADTVAHGPVNPNAPEALAASPTNLQIIQGVQSKISGDIILSKYRISVTSENGIVTLDGNVDTETQANTAIALAKSVPGVKSVNSKLIARIINVQPTANTPTNAVAR